MSEESEADNIARVRAAKSASSNLQRELVLNSKTWKIPTCQCQNCKTKEDRNRRKFEVFLPASGSGNGSLHIPLKLGDDSCKRDRHNLAGNPPAISKEDLLAMEQTTKRMNMVRGPLTSFLLTADTLDITSVESMNMIDEDDDRKLLLSPKSKVIGKFETGTIDVRAILEGSAVFDTLQDPSNIKQSITNRIRPSIPCRHRMSRFSQSWRFCAILFGQDEQSHPTPNGWRLCFGVPSTVITSSVIPRVMGAGNHGGLELPSPNLGPSTKGGRRDASDQSIGKRCDQRGNLVHRYKCGVAPIDFKGCLTSSRKAEMKELMSDMKIAMANGSFAVSSIETIEVVRASDQGAKRKQVVDVSCLNSPEQPLKKRRTDVEKQVSLNLVQKILKDSGRSDRV